MNIFIDKIIKEYDGRRVLDVESLQIKDGAFCGVIGPNGSGKSTLLNIIAGLTEATSGQVFYEEHGVTEPPFKNMTMVFQAPYLLRTTVEKNIAYPLKLRGWKPQDIDKRVRELADELGLTDFLKHKSWNLSGGEAQKVALARALSFRPDLLLLDEPTANIDPAATAEIERMLKKTNEEEGTTIIVITHNLVQAKRLCKEILLLNKGEAVEFGPGEKMLRNPDNELTRRFIAGEILT
ncbi:MAG: ATP-binding cassette protein [Firmicutes bacterium]|nr:ATP-binding cassette protein [Bacillota bacterium]